VDARRGAVRAGRRRRRVRGVRARVRDARRGRGSARVRGRVRRGRVLRAGGHARAGGVPVRRGRAVRAVTLRRAAHNSDNFRHNFALARSLLLHNKTRERDRPACAGARSHAVVVGHLVAEVVVRVRAFFCR